MGFITSLLVLSFLVFFHELGHFLAARLFGVRVNAFSIGFGKQKIWKKQIGDTEYSLRPIPLGGFVELKGQSDLDPKNRNYDKDSLYGISSWKRLVILAAGSFFNILLAFLLYMIIALVGQKELAPIIGKIAPNSPAQIANLKPNDEVIRLNNTPIKTWESLNQGILNSKGSIELVILREGKEYEVTLTPQIGKSQNIFKEEISRPLVGITAKGEAKVVSYSLTESFGVAFSKTLEASYLIIKGIEKLITGVVPVSEVGGVVSIVSITKHASELGIITLFAFSALISVNLGILNLLPIPALDGGHIIFTLYEMVTKKIPSLNTLYRLTMMGWVFLIGLMGLGLYNDIIRLINGTIIP